MTEKFRCDLCGGGGGGVDDDDDAFAPLTFASSADISSWSNRMLKLDWSTPSLTLCPVCVAKIVDVGFLLWQWKAKIAGVDRVVADVDRVVVADVERTIKPEPTYDPASPGFAEEGSGERGREGESTQSRLEFSLDDNDDDVAEHRATSGAKVGVVEDDEEEFTSTASYLDASRKEEDSRAERFCPVESDSLVDDGGVAEKPAPGKRRRRLRPPKKEREMPTSAPGLCSSDGTTTTGETDDSARRAFVVEKREDETEARSHQFVCIHCGKTFLRERSLLTHSTIHTGKCGGANFRRRSWDRIRYVM